ncbi:hypothetical protein GCM10018953_39060 [Streptosporangium nondiastaticum]
MSRSPRPVRSPVRSDRASDRPAAPAVPAVPAGAMPATGSYGRPLIASRNSATNRAQVS